MAELYDQIQEAQRHLQTRWTGKPRVGIILGTGLGGLVEEIQAELRGQLGPRAYTMRP